MCTFMCYVVVTYNAVVKSRSCVYRAFCLW